jgi:hypothetical protein
MTPPDPLPLLDEQAVEAMAKRRWETAQIGFVKYPWDNADERLREDVRASVRGDLAAYFAALDRAELIERACAAQWGEKHWPNVPNAAGERVYMRKALEALGLFSPDT